MQKVAESGEQVRFLGQSAIGWRPPCKLLRYG